MELPTGKPVLIFLFNIMDPSQALTDEVIRVLTEREREPSSKAYYPETISSSVRLP